MIRSLNTGVLGIRQYQTSLDAIGNNLANINTVAYKAARIDFADTLNQTLRAPTPDTDTVSGSTGMQVGNGLSITAIKNSFEQGAIKQTGVRTDLAIAGEGFFLVKDPTTNELFATRAGDFRTDKNGYLVTNGGQRVQGLNKLAPAYTTAEKKEIGDLQLDEGTYMEDRTGVTIDSKSEVLTKNAHGFTTGMQVKFSSGTVPTTDPSITGSTVLYVRNDSADSTNKFTLHSTASEAAAGTNAINFSATTGTPPKSNGNIRVNAFDDALTLTSHGYSDGMKVKFKTSAPSGGDTITEYYTKKIDANTFSLHTGSTMTVGNKVNFAPATTGGWAVSVADDELTLNAHGLNSGDTVRFSGTAPGGGATTTTYYARVISANKISLHASAADAGTGSDKINLTTASGTYSLLYDKNSYTIEGQDYTAYTLGGGASISSFNVGADGKVNMLLTDGTQYSRGQLIMQNFKNTQNLMKQGGNIYSNLATAGALGTTGNSASATQILTGAEAPGSAGMGRIESGALELSNVDMAKEFARMITTQRAFQANARVVTTSDEILQEMMQLKR
tara:strand:+ start:183 stop:1862 length:1680 start_codon:yes stop_codon:yes gene_type:complete